MKKERGETGIEGNEMETGWEEKKGRRRGKKEIERRTRAEIELWG